MKRICWLLLALFFLTVTLPGMDLAGNLAVAQDNLRVAKIAVTQGEVKVLRAGGERAFAAYQGMGLTQGDTIETGQGGQVTLAIDEDKELKIAENTRIMISELMGQSNTEQTAFNLKAGQVYTRVKNKLAPGSKYEIRTYTAVMGVRGTQFFVSLDEGQAEVVTLEGKVSVNVPQITADGSSKIQAEAFVLPNQRFAQIKGEKDPAKFKLDTLDTNKNLSLFVLETLKDIEQKQPNLLDKKLLKDLDKQIEESRKVREEKLKQEKEQTGIGDAKASAKKDSKDSSQGASKDSSKGPGKDSSKDSKKGKK